jgi:TolA-binding protein
LTQAAEKLFALKDHQAADRVARQVLALDPPAAPEQRRVAWTVVSHAAFEAGAFDRAEKGYVEALALMPANAAGRHELVERQAAAIYKQAEQARAAGKAREAVAQFTRVAQSAPQSSVHAAALYDAAATLISLKDWDAAAQALETFRRTFPKHALVPEAGSKLAAIYLEQQRWGPAAGEFERMAATQTDARLAAESMWQAAELHEKAGSRDNASRVYAQYAKQYPAPFERNLEARWRLAQALRSEPKTPANVAREAALMRELRDADLRAGSARTERTRTIGGLAALALTQPLLDDYRKVALVEPLARQLKLKKAKMEAALQAYAQASTSAAPEVVTAATFHTAALYQDFGKALMTSQRPKGLNKAALEQYNVMLEEQAFPFEEKATELHETNARRAASGLYDEWVKKSFTALRELRPVRYGKNERGEGAIDAIR